MFEPFVAAYCKKFAYSVITAQLFKEFFLDYFKDKVPAEVGRDLVLLLV